MYLRRASLGRIAMLAVALSVSLVAGKTWTVGDSLRDFTTITDALDSVGVGDTIRVSSGAYQAPNGVEMRIPGVALIGDGADRTTIDGQGRAYAVINVSAPSVTVKGFTMRGGRSHGLYVNDTNSAIIKLNIITGNGDRGILLGQGSPHADITGNTIVANMASAIYSYHDDPRIVISNNIIAANGRGIVTDTVLTRTIVKYNCFWNQSTDSAQAAAGPGNLRADPMFVDSAHDDFHLRPGSPCLGGGEDGRNIGALGTNSPSSDTTAADTTRPAAPAGLADLRIVVFAKDSVMADRVLVALRNDGFTNPGSYVSPGPNPEANVKYGPAADGAIDQIVGRLHDYYPVELKKVRDLPPANRDVYVNLP